MGRDPVGGGHAGCDDVAPAMCQDGSNLQRHPRPRCPTRHRISEPRRGGQREEQQLVAALWCVASKFGLEFVFVG